LKSILCCLDGPNPSAAANLVGTPRCYAQTRWREVADRNRWVARSEHLTPRRKSARFAVVLVVTISLLCPGFGRADQLLPLTFNNSRHGFSISFPAGWAQMPPGKLESANQTAMARHPEWKSPILHYGYQMTNSEGLAFVPYVVIRVTDTDHPSDAKGVEEELEKSEDLPEWPLVKPSKICGI
jgi:hypothetical protein